MNIIIKRRYRYWYYH